LFRKTCTFAAGASKMGPLGAPHQLRGIRLSVGNQGQAMLRLKCPKCQTAIRLYESEIGTTVVCPQCGKKLRVPGAKPKSEEELPPVPPTETRPVPPAQEPAPAGTQLAPRKTDDSDVVVATEVPRRSPAPKKLPRFETEPYQVTGGVNLVGACILFSFTIPAALLCGFLLSFIGQWFYLILLFPGAAALGVVALGFVGVQTGKVHSPLTAGLIGALAGIATMLAMHYFDYLRFLGLLQAQAPGFPAPGLFGFIDARAQAGVVLAGKGGGQGMNLGYVGSYIYFAVELLFVVAICGAAIYGFARAPFCTACNSWKKERTLGGFTLPVRGKAPETCDAAKAAFSKGDVTMLINEDPEREGEHVSFVLTAFECPNCGEETPVDVTLKCATKDKEGKDVLVELAKVTYAAEAVPVLERLCASDEETEEQLEES
jgi:lysine biosynthesis protein LysW